MPVATHLELPAPEGQVRMDFFYSDDEIDFRGKVRSFFAENVPDTIRSRMLLGQNVSPDELRQWHRILDDKGWAAPAWDPDWGGTGWTPLQLHIFREELQLAGAPQPFTINMHLAGPIIIAFGSDEQRRRFLPGIRRLDYWFAQGFSEPGAGSDLAALRTSAVREGDEYVVNGQKAWTTLAHHANWMFTLVRTSSAGRKQDGITYLLIDMETPGIDVRPVLTLDRDRHVNEVFLDNVRVPVANRVGEENKAWSYAKYLLTHERAGAARTALTKLKLARIKQIARSVSHNGRPMSEDARFREKLAGIEVELRALEITVLRVLSDMEHNKSNDADPRSSILKIRGSELQQRADEILVELAGPAALPFLEGFLDGEPSQALPVPDWAGTASQKYFLDRATTIYAGTSEVQRNILAKGILRL